MVFLLLLLKIGLLFVPQEEYECKVAAIAPMAQKNAGFDLGGWTYEKVVACDGTIHRYYHRASSAPDAPALLMLHGLNLDGRTFLNFDTLASTFRLVAYDFPERSSRYTGDIDDFCALVEQFAATMGIDSAVLCGVSFGGVVGLRVAARGAMPGLRALILVSTLISGATEAERKRNRETVKLLSPLPDYKVYWIVEKLIERSQKSTGSVTDGSVSAILRIKHPDFFRQVTSAIERYDGRADAAAVRCPVLAIQGGSDEQIDPARRELLRTHIRNIDYQVIGGGTHDMAYTRAPEVAQRIRRFYQSFHP